MTIYSRIYLKTASRCLSFYYDLPRLEEDELYALSHADIPIPMVKHNGAGTVWYDPLYCAYRLTDQPVKYVYISKRHIIEEIRSYRTAAALRHTKIALPPQIMRQFLTAYKFMKARGCDVWTESRYECA